MNFGRIITAMVTPFGENGDIDFSQVKNLVDYLLSNGTEAIVVNGTTGESPTLTDSEKMTLIESVVQHVAGRVPVIAGTGSNNTRSSIEMTVEAEKLGVDAVMLVAPYYNKPSQEGMFLHFQEIANATTLPVMLYNIPGRTGVNIEPETIIRLSKIDNIVAVKDATGNLDDMATIIRETDEAFSVYSGDDQLTLPVLAIGGAGVVSVSSHLYGNEMSEMVEAHYSGSYQRASEIHRWLVPKMNTLFMAPNPVPVKTALNYLGIEVGMVRLPLIPLNEQEKVQLFHELNLNINNIKVG